MNDNNTSEISETSNSENMPEIIEMRNRHLQNFAEWMVKSGLSPIDYELVEERRSDGATLWYFQKREDPPQDFYEPKNQLSN